MQIYDVFFNTTWENVSQFFFSIHPQSEEENSKYTLAFTAFATLLASALAIKCFKNTCPSLLNSSFLKGRMADYKVNQLLTACQKGNNKLVEIHEELIRNFPSDKKRTTPLIEACKYFDSNNKNYMKIITFILGIGAKVNEKNATGSTALHYAAKNGNVELAQKLIHYGAVVDEIDANKFTPLQHAAIQGNTKLVEILIHFGANINYQKPSTSFTDLADGLNENKDKSSSTPLALAVLHKHIDVVKVLLSSKANIEVKQGLVQESLLHIAVCNGDEKMTTLLLEKLEIDSKNRYFETPLHYAAKKGFNGIVTMLIEKKANIEAKDEKGKTPLHFAAKNGNKEVVEILLHYSANKEELDNKNKKPIDLATNEKIIQLLNPPR